MDTKRLSAPPPSDRCANVLDLLVKVGLVAGQAAGHLGELAS